MNKNSLIFRIRLSQLETKNSPGKVPNLKVLLILQYYNYNVSTKSQSKGSNKKQVQKMTQRQNEAKQTKRIIPKTLNTDHTSYSFVFILHQCKSRSLMVLALWLRAASVNLKRGLPPGVLGVLQTKPKDAISFSRFLMS